MHYYYFSANFVIKQLDNTLIFFQHDQQIYLKFKTIQIAHANKHLKRYYNFFKPIKK